MINLEKLESFKEAFHFFAHQLSYPEKLTFHPEFFEASVSPDLPGSEHIKRYWDQVHRMSLDELREAYTTVFDFEKSSTLYMTYFKFEDGKERGQMLAKLKVLYEMFGLDMPGNELSDFLPLMCEFIYAADWSGDDRAQRSFQIMFAVLEDGTYNLLKSLEKSNEAYYFLIKGLRECLKACVIPQEVSPS
ncbi:nitrate reductase sununit delta [Jeotgalibacillus alimentarius]|uniref:Nitrate reductase sununit delta n=1 Tax=Jeotgalibacillus alimentarius TaxID=135826 RepID=A0A0C2W3P0_9BACL|nr:nitrate reductase molybdenum cofactor assembly chaperone [Jeotgalibacillus alimentarius]KIL51231.1 nitrate reductase sununit delta [Jeotgalibacillus alimentarius]